MDQQIKQMKEIIKDSNNIVFFGGAGVSTASGIPDFRSATGLYNQKTEGDYSPEYLLSHEFLTDHPEEFCNYYKGQLIFPDAKPNKAHIALATLEKLGKLRAVITQNIDGLHQMAGSTNVLELHGNLQDHYCLSCGQRYDLDYAMKQKGKTLCEKCGGFVRPDVVLYGESLNMSVLQQAVEAIAQADVLIVAGTSLVVYPAAGLVRYYRGNKLMIINQQSTPRDNSADFCVHDDLTKVMDELVQDL